MLLEQRETVQCQDSEVHGYPPRHTPNSRNRESFHLIVGVLLCITGGQDGRAKGKQKHAKEMK